ncbi:hypothetical protein ACHAQH_007575 [Verticillium albo-atrum]
MSGGAYITNDVLIAAQRRLRQPGFFLPQRTILDEDCRAIWVALKAHPLCDDFVYPSRSDLLWLKQETAGCLELVFKTCIDVINQRFAIKIVADFPMGGLLVNVIAALVEYEGRWKSLMVCNETDDAHERFRDMLFIYLRARKAYLEQGNVQVNNLSHAETSLLSTIDKLIQLLDHKKRLHNEACQKSEAKKSSDEAGGKPSYTEASKYPQASAPSASPINQVKHSINACHSTKGSPATNGNTNGRGSAPHPTESTEHKMSIDKLVSAVNTLEQKIDKIDDMVKPLLGQVCSALDARKNSMQEEMKRNALTFHSHFDKALFKLGEDFNVAMNACSNTAKDISANSTTIESMNTLIDELKAQIMELEKKTIADKKTIGLSEAKANVLEKLSVENERQRDILAAEQQALGAEKDLVVEQLCWVFEEMLPAYNKERKNKDSGMKNLTTADLDRFVALKPELSKLVQHISGASNRSQREESVAHVETAPEKCVSVKLAAIMPNPVKPASVRPTPPKLVSPESAPVNPEPVKIDPDQAVRVDAILDRKSVNESKAPVERKEESGTLVEVSESCPKPCDKAVQEVLELERIMAAFTI